MSNTAAHMSRWETGEVVFGIPFLVGIALNFFLPLPIMQGTLRLLLIPLGILLVLGGLRLIGLARREFNQFNQPTSPGLPTSSIVQTGVFAVSRNPLYLGGVLIILGLALAFNLIWGLIALLVSIVLCWYILIRPEEVYLTEKFGDEYRAYTASVSRWLGRRR